MKQGSYIVVWALCLTLVGSARGSQEDGFFAVREFDEGLQVNTPYGVLTVPGNYSSRTRYKFSVPLEDIKIALEKSGEDTRYLGRPDFGPPPFPREPAEDGKDREPDAIKPPTFADPALDRLVVEANRLYNRRKFYDALLLVDRIVALAPEYARGWLMKGSLLYLQGQKDLAKRAWEEAKKLDPSNKDVATALEVFK